MVSRAVERGINYFDTSPDYSQTGSEQVIGKALKPHRDKVFIASKFCTAAGHLPPETPVADIIAAVEASLQRLQTDYLDVCIIHEVNGLDRLMAPTFHEAFDRLHEQGKVRFLGVSSHTPNLEEVMRHAVDCGRFQMLLVAYNFNNWPDLTTIFHDAKRRGVGVVAMKTLKGAKASVLKDFDDPTRAFSQAAFKWVLSNPNVSGLVVSMTDFAADRRVSLRVRSAARGLRPGAARALRRVDRARLLPAGVRRMPRQLSVRGAGRRRLPLCHVLRELRAPARRAGALRRPVGGAQRRALRGLPRTVRGGLSVRDPDP